MMLTISPLSRPITKDELNITSFSDLEDQFADFPEFSAPVGCLLDSIDFDVLPDLEMDPADFIAEFSFSAGDVFDDEEADSGIQVVPECCKDDGENGSRKSGVKASKDEGDESEKSTSSSSRCGKEKDKSKKSQAKKSNSNNEGKRKTKVDWTPELHRRFVEAVEQLGVEKAVPSRILELMGIHCLTRHNVASHLQKYRSHRKHLLAREAEAASWSQKRQMYGIAVTPVAGGGGKTKLNHTWHSPAIGFPPMAPAPPPVQHHHNRHPYKPLHVWGHPTPHHVKPQSVMPMWHKQPTPTFWHPHHHGPNVVTTPTNTSCFPQALPATRFAAAPPVAGVPPPHPAMYKHQPTPPGHPPIDLHPTKESIDAVLGDVLSKPWLPLPIGLKPPSMDIVLVELHRQGVSKIPPS